jgi:intracellular multiplication protein IcmQ
MDELAKQKIDKVLKALDKVIEGHTWDESNFLKVLGKKLRTVREEFAEKANSFGQDKSKITSHLANRVALRSGQQEIFIALYSSDGGNIQSWERIVSNLPRQIVSRPIYVDENDLKAVIKTKENRVNEAYVACYVNQADILEMPIDKAPVDKLGKPLLTLKDKSVSLDNMNCFVHSSGVYRYVHGRLVKNLAVNAD